MAIHHDRTAAPICQRGLLRAFAEAAPVPTPTLTAETVAMLDAVVPDTIDDVRRDFDALIAGTRAELPIPPLLSAADHASALHLRRQLEAAAEHGADLLAALGLPRLVRSDTIIVDPVAAGDALDAAIAALDALDGDTDREPYLAGWYNGAIDPDGEREGEEDPDENDGTSEPSLASPERHPTVPWSGNHVRHYVTRDRQDTQARWADGGRQDLEGCITDEPHDGDGEDLEAEPAEDSLGSAAGNGDQTHWSQGEAGEREADPTDDVRLYKEPAEWEATFARRDGLRDLARRARALRGRKAPSPDTVLPIAPGVVWWAGPGL